MPTYVMLTKLTTQGLQTLRSNPDRLREVNQDVDELGCKVLHQWFLLGPYDFLNVIEAPDAQTVARVAVGLGARGSLHTETYEALGVDELLNVLAD